MGVKAECEKKTLKGLRSTYLDKFDKDSDLFFTPKGEFSHSTTRYRPGNNRAQLYGEPPFNERFEIGGKYNTPSKARFDDSRFTKSFESFGRDTTPQSRGFSSFFDKNNKGSFDSRYMPRHSLQAGRFNRSEENSKYDRNVFGGRSKDNTRSYVLPDYDASALRGLRRQDSGN